MYIQENLVFVASNPATPAHVLDDLANHKEASIVERVAGNINTGPETLSRLAIHTEPQIRLAVAENMNTPLPKLEFLARDENPDIRYLLAESPHIPIGLIQTLTQDENPYVQVRAERTLHKIRGDHLPAVQSHGGIAESVIPDMSAEEPTLQASSLSTAEHIPGLATTIHNLQAPLERSPKESALTTEYVRQISSKLRTMLSAVMGMNELLLSTDLTTGQWELARATHDSGHSMLSFISDLEDMSRFEQAPSDPENIPFNVIFVVQDSARPFAGLAEQKGIILSTQIDQRIPELSIGDPAQLRGVLHTLIRLAIKSTDKGQVTVEAFVDAADESKVTVRFTVRNTTATKSRTDAVASLWPQTDSPQLPTDHPGMTTIKQLVEAMNGTLDLHNTDDGHAISFNLPFRRPFPAASWDENEASPANASVLVVEDDPTLQRVVIKQLDLLGVEAKAVTTGQEALDCVKNGCFSIVLMDCYLPDLDGFEATKSIRKYEALLGRHTPIVAMTAAAMPGDEEKCLASGMDAYLSKPFNREQLQGKLKQWLQFKHRAKLHP